MGQAALQKNRTVFDRSAFCGTALGGFFNRTEFFQIHFPWLPPVRELSALPTEGENSYATVYFFMLSF